MGQWIMKTLEPTAESELPHADCLRALWCALGVPAELLDPVIEMRVIFLNGKLKISQSFLEDPEWCEKLTHCLSSLFKIPSWTCSRWCTFGAACRSLTTSLLL
eukprot:3761457-Amphidinium_carterae.1